MGSLRMDELKPGAEEKIKSAARELFHRKGYAGTKSRDIANAAGINVAMLNYYFRSKQKLFDLIMLESLQHFLSSMSDVFNDEKTDLDTKIRVMIGNYIDLLIDQPDIPLFIMTELRAHPTDLIHKMGAKDLLMRSFFFRQLQERLQKSKSSAVHPLHFLMNIMGMTIFPFISSPMLKNLGNMSDKNYTEMMIERKKLIPLWVKNMLR